MTEVCMEGGEGSVMEGGEGEEVCNGGCEGEGSV